MRSRVALEVIGFDADALARLSVRVLRSASLRSAIASFSILPLSSQSSLRDQPTLLRRRIGGMELARQVPEMLAGMIEIDDLDRAGKVLIGDVPDPVGAIADDDFGWGAVPSAVPGLGIDPKAELFGGFDGADVGGGIGIAHGRPWSSTLVCVNTQPSLHSRVRAGWPGVLPVRPSVSVFTTNTCVPSIWT